MTVPFIMSLGVGVAAVRSGKKSGDDSFGLVALSSIGPILAVLVLGIIYKAQGANIPYRTSCRPETTPERLYRLRQGLGEIRAGSAPRAVADCGVFRAVSTDNAGISPPSAHKGNYRARIYVCGTDVLFDGRKRGVHARGAGNRQSACRFWNGWLLVPVGMLLGYFVVSAEPAVYVLNKQVEHMSAGAVSASTMKKGLCIGVCAALGFSMLRIVLGFNVMWLLLPGYAAALVLMIFTPKLFTGIAFDSGGVASGAMVSSFVLPWQSEHAPCLRRRRL